MNKILCDFDGVFLYCNITENLGFQGGDNVRAVDYNGKERIVVKRGQVWKPKPSVEKIILK